jgi:hypothetical protein
MKPLALLTLAACAPLPVLTPAESAATEAARAAWLERGMPAPDQRRCQLDRVYVLHASEAEYVQHCHALPTKSAGCLSWTSSNHFFRPYDWPLLVIGPKYAGDQGLIIHEMLHAHVRCAALGTSPWDPGDREHHDPRVWSAAGGESAVQALANEKLADGGAP